MYKLKPTYGPVSASIDPEPWTPKFDLGMAFYVVIGGVSLLLAWIFLLLWDWFFSSLCFLVGLLTITGVIQAA